MIQMGFQDETRAAIAIVLGEIQVSIDRMVYPELDAYIAIWFAHKDSTVDLTELSNAMMKCDRTEILPKPVVDFIVPNYEAAAEVGDLDAMFNLGELYFTGRCGKQSYEKAIMWYTKAHEEGSPKSTEKLGNYYYFGYGVHPDYEKAYRFFSKCEMLGWANSLFMIGDMFRYGQFVEHDENMAFRMYKEAFNALDDELKSTMGAEAFRRLADCYYEGIGTDRNYLTALSLYQSAERYYYVKMMDHTTFELSDLESVLKSEENCRNRIVENLHKELYEYYN